MGAITTAAVLTTGIAIGAAGHIALTTTPEGSHVAAAPVVHASAAPRTEALPIPAMLPRAQDVAEPRECNPAEGVITDCSYE